MNKRKKYDLKSLAGSLVATSATLVQLLYQVLLT